MAGPSAKQIPYGMDGIHMELASIPPGIRLECGGTVKTSQKHTFSKTLPKSEMLQLVSNRAQNNDKM